MLSLSLRLLIYRLLHVALVLSPSLRQLLQLHLNFVLIVFLLPLATMSHYNTTHVAYLIGRLLEYRFLEMDTNLDHSIQIWRVQRVLARKA